MKNFLYIVITSILFLSCSEDFPANNTFGSWDNPSDYQFENRTNYTVTSVSFTEGGEATGDSLYDIRPGERSGMKSVGSYSDKARLVKVVISELNMEFEFSFHDRKDSIYRLVLIENNISEKNFMLLKFPIGEVY